MSSTHTPPLPHTPPNAAVVHHEQPSSLSSLLRSSSHIPSFPLQYIKSHVIPAYGHLFGMVRMALVTVMQRTHLCSPHDALGHTTLMHQHVHPSVGAQDSNACTQCHYMDSFTHIICSLGIIGASYASYRLTTQILKSLSSSAHPSSPHQKARYWYNKAHHQYLQSRTHADRALALKYFLKAAHYNHPPSLLNCAMFYKNGIGCDKNDAKAFRYLRRCVRESDEALAHFQLAEYYSRGFADRSDQGSDGTSATESSNARTRRHTTNDVATSGSARRIKSHHRNSTSDANGTVRMRATDRNLKKAFHHYKIAATKGAHVGGMLKLASCYDFGYAVPVSEEKAFQWYLRAAQAGSGTAARELALRYENGVGCKADKEQARVWRERYVESGEI
mmetsp:Transcript_9772/g.36433  ORF Transcript_9772/g.36433 Transcript_9772/m.36433 type:complete len:390 (+) Transcript_9772:19-1188(+)